MEIIKKVERYILVIFAYQNQKLNYNYLFSHMSRIITFISSLNKKLYLKMINCYITIIQWASISNISFNIKSQMNHLKHWIMEDHIGPYSVLAGPYSVQQIEPWWAIKKASTIHISGIIDLFLFHLLFIYFFLKFYNKCTIPIFLLWLILISFMVVIVIIFLSFIYTYGKINIF